MLRRFINELRRYPSAVAGPLIIVSLVIVSFYAVISMPYDEAVMLWRGGDGVWADTPRNAAPKWVNLFTRKNLPETITLNTFDNDGIKQLEYVSDEFTQAQITLSFDYNY